MDCPLIQSIWINYCNVTPNPLLLWVKLPSFLANEFFLIYHEPYTCFSREIRSKEVSLVFRLLCVQTMTFRLSSDQNTFVQSYSRQCHFKNFELFLDQCKTYEMCDRESKKCYIYFANIVYFCNFCYHITIHSERLLTVEGITLI